MPSSCSCSCWTKNNDAFKERTSLCIVYCISSIVFEKCDTDNSSIALVALYWWTTLAILISNASALWYCFTILAIIFCQWCHHQNYDTSLMMNWQLLFLTFLPITSNKKAQQHRGDCGQQLRTHWCNKPCQCCHLLVNWWVVHNIEGIAKSDSLQP